MIKRLAILSLSFSFGLSSIPASAQDSEAVHALLKDRFYASIGAYILDKKMKIGLNGRDANDLIDFSDRWSFGSSETSAAGEFRWQFGKKWSVSGQYFTSSDQGRATLDEDVYWGDYVFREGTFASAGVGMDVARVFMGRRFSTGPHHEFGVGVGIHWITLDAFIEGEAFINDESTGVRRESADVSGPLPNIGAWYDYAFSSKWLGSARIDWLDVNFDKYSGGLLNASVGIDYQAFKHVGFSLAYQYFNLDVEVDDTTWRGAVEIEYSGPFLSATFNW